MHIIKYHSLPELFVANVLICDKFIVSEVTGNITCDMRLSGPDICGYVDISLEQPGWILREIEVYNQSNSSETQCEHVLFPIAGFH